MKKAFCILLSLLLFVGILPSGMAAQAKTPVLALTYVPVYDAIGDIEGVLYCTDGSSFDTAAYRITLYLQVTSDGAYWVKPTYAETYRTVSSSGRFVYPFITGGEDARAQILHLLVVPASFTPDSDFSRTRNAAVDYVKITRSPGGSVTVSPNREAPDPEVGKASGLAVNSDKIALNVGFYTDGSQPGDTLSADLIRDQLNAIRPFTDTIRLYGAAGELAKAYPIARTLGFRIVGSAWLCGDTDADKAELDALIAHCNAGLVDLAVVGSETLLRGDLTPALLLEDMQYVRSRLKKDIPVTTADSADILLAQVEVRHACDVLFVNVYPYWNGTASSKAAAAFISTMEALRRRCPNKELICSETGWPTEGGQNGSALADESAAAAYFTALRQWSVQSGIQIFYFDAADEPWKTANEGGVGSHWGILDSKLQMKPCYAALDFFRLAYERAGQGNFQRTKTYTAGQFRDVSADAWYARNVQAVYEYALMQGDSAVSFRPKGNLTVAEAITIACRIYNIYNGYNPTYAAGAKWYDGYVAYAKAVGIVKDGQFADYNRAATRAEVAQLLTDALPVPALRARNTVSENAIPDVHTSAAYADAVYTLYRAGILGGNDSIGTFAPNRTITRAEIAAMITRIADPNLRLNVTL